jgi:hypothetical protein
MTRAGRAAFLSVCATVLGVSGGSAQENRSWVLDWENDAFARTDRFYTNGVRLSHTRDTFAVPWWLPEGTVRALFPSCQDGSSRTACFQWREGWAIGQSIFTPEDIRESELIVDDRPYGGWLQAGFFFQAVRSGPGIADELHALELDVGVTGPPSLAEQTQKLWHEFIVPSPIPRGWDHQIKFEPGVTVSYEGKRRILEGDTRGGMRFFDVIPHWNVSLGNIFSNAGAGGVVRLGYNLSSGFGPLGKRSGAPIGSGGSDQLEAYMFAGAQGGVVLRNIFLDGNTFRPSHSVDRKNWVGDLQVGTALRLRRFVLTYRFVVRSNEFGPSGVPSRYGSVRLAIIS